MCGICGIIRWDGEPVDAALIRAMADRMIHRGPDGEGVFIWPEASPSPSGRIGVGLGNRRLAVIDPQGGQQPVSNEEGTITVVYNGEIYNYRELRAGLEAQGHHFRSQSDTEVIVHQYEQDGWRCVEQFRGMFAFALWDAPNRTLLLARDRIGIKPLYYTKQGQQLLFASELWSLLRGLGRLPVLDPIALSQLFILQYLPAPQTLFPNIYKLPAATVALWHDEKLEVIPYWTSSRAQGRSPVDSDGGGGVRSSEGEWAGELRRRLDEAVTAHLVSDVPIGAFLSGGLDSSVIVALMQRALGEPVRTFTVGFDGQSGRSGEGELGYARHAASAIGTVHREIIVTPERFVGALPQVIGALDDPVLDPAVVPTLILSQLARQEVTVALTGEGGDELFGGYQRYRLQRWARLARAVPRSWRSVMLRRVRSWRIRQGLEASWADSPAARHLGWVASAPLSELRHLCGDPAHLDHAVRLLVERFDQLLMEGPSGQTPPEAVAAMMDLDRRTWLPDDLLVKVDRMAMAVSLEARVPYLDHRLVEWVARMPVGLKVRGGRGKWLLKRAAEGLLPDSIIHRSKQGFEPPLARWLRGPMGADALEQVTESLATKLGFWDRRTIERWFGAHRRGEGDYSLLLWGVWSFALWYDHLMTEGRSLSVGSE